MKHIQFFRNIEPIIINSIEDAIQDFNNLIQNEEETTTSEKEDNQEENK
jgi:hypothetical protein